MLRKIVVGVDGSETATHALRMACDLAQKYQSDLHVVHAPQPRTVAFALGAMAAYHAATAMPSAAEVKEASDKVLASAKAVADESGQTIITYLKSGDPADALIACAKDCEADLIVTGRRGLGTLGALVQGSTTQRVNHLAECACLSVI